ncbi:UDP-N-acetylglucosamine 2-epimerase [Desulforhopalus sp. IMCC35007]|uniref:UDP-N-acetylglucosamine 2-epimerase n=1 Tax=Desulforhopalus sp. IMCC35007 TaxID=2569543 RepID=UPI0010AE3A3B|nr:UDP-N-acetylglucosamine 2-epimerase [Desulforhopalus sp. IMCC35007]TKB05601.1 UDP-N-acetylglucosamine 2-epimerase (hydrolyzing) [Desulforhopalus sp. IMCC35007]
MKKILFITGTRADFGKLKPLIRAVENHPDFEYAIFATGMHMLYRYGMTVEEIHKAGFTNIFTFMNQVHGEPMEMVLANTISGLSRYVHESEPDLIVVHGDRVEALAGATVGALRNILVGHIEGGEVSGTIDELIRHSTSKLAHLHFVANQDAEARLIQLGEMRNSIHIIGSPDIDIMLSGQLPDINTVKTYYEIEFERHAILMFHPVTTEIADIPQQVKALINAVLKSSLNYVVIFPNNDSGSKHILDEYKRLEGVNNVKLFPSIRFEYFLSLLKNAQFILGNSSAGIHEAPVFGVPTINIGSRQQNRFSHSSIFNVSCTENEIFEKIETMAQSSQSFPSCKHFGGGKSAQKFISELENDSFWKTSKQKVFQNIV